MEPFYCVYPNPTFGNGVEVKRAPTGSPPAPFPSASGWPRNTPSVSAEEAAITGSVTSCVCGPERSPQCRQGLETRHLMHSRPLICQSGWFFAPLRLLVACFLNHFEVKRLRHSKLHKARQSDSKSRQLLQSMTQHQVRAK